MTPGEVRYRLARAVHRVNSLHHFYEEKDGKSYCLCGFVGSVRTQTEHITNAVLEAFDHDQPDSY